jgi:DNA-binding response OmpR family regulator
MTWERWCALRRAALTEHPWPQEAVRHLVELVPEGTRRVRPDGAIGERCAFVVDPSPSLRFISNTLLSIPGFRVETFDTPAEAVQRSMVGFPDIMVMVPRGEVGDAIAQMRALHELHGHQAPPVIWCANVTPTLDQVQEGAGLGLRAVIVTPWRLTALIAVTVRVCREAQRERRLLALGVPADQIASRTLSLEGTRLWAQVEAELTAESAKPLALVSVGSDSVEVVGAVRAVIRAGDMIGRAVDGSLTVLLPDVDEAGARSASARIAQAVSAMRPRPAVAVVSRRLGEDPVTLFARHAAELRSAALRDPCPHRSAPLEGESAA